MRLHHLLHVRALQKFRLEPLGKVLIEPGKNAFRFILVRLVVVGGGGEDHDPGEPKRLVRKVAFDIHVLYLAVRDRRFLFVQYPAFYLQRIVAKGKFIVGVYEPRDKERHKKNNGENTERGPGDRLHNRPEIAERGA